MVCITKNIFFSDLTGFRDEIELIINDEGKKFKFTLEDGEGEEEIIGLLQALHMWFVRKRGVFYFMQ